MYVGRSDVGLPLGIVFDGDQDLQGKTWETSSNKVRAYQWEDRRRVNGK